MQGLHRKYDKNLIHDDENDIERHLEEKRRRLERMRKMTLRQLSLSPEISKLQRRHSSGANLPQIPEVPSRRRLLSESDASVPKPNLDAFSDKEADKFDIISEEEPKPKPRFYLSSKKEKSKDRQGSEKSQRMILLHDQDTIKGDSDISCDDESHM